MTVSVTKNTSAFPGHTLGEWGNAYAFAAIKADGSVVFWGDPASGGDGYVYTYGFDLEGNYVLLPDHSVAAQVNGTMAVTQIFSSGNGFAALRADGSVVTWGQGGGDSSAVAAQLDGTVDVTRVFPLAALSRHCGPTARW